MTSGCAHQGEGRLLVLNHFGQAYWCALPSIHWYVCVGVWGGMKQEKCKEDTP